MKAKKKWVAAEVKTYTKHIIAGKSSGGTEDESGAGSSKTGS